MNKLNKLSSSESKMKILYTIANRARKRKNESVYLHEYVRYSNIENRAIRGIIAEIKCIGKKGIVRPLRKEKQEDNWSMLVID